MVLRLSHMVPQVAQTMGKNQIHIYVAPHGDVVLVFSNDGLKIRTT